MVSLPIFNEGRSAKVSLVNLNLISVPAVAPYALDILGTALEAAGHEVRVLDLAREEDWVSAVQAHFAGFSPDVVAMSLRNYSDIHFPSYDVAPDDGSFLPTHSRVIDAIKQHVPIERMIIGGVGFSMAPYQVLERLGLLYGVRGPGEHVLPIFVAAVAAGADLRGLPVGKEARGNLLLFDGRKDPIQRRVKRSFVDNAWYYRYGGLGNFRSSNGCGMNCSYCCDPIAKGKGFNVSSAEDVTYELDQLVELGIYDIHTTDSEFNMPLPYVKGVLRRIAERAYPKQFHIWPYVQPTPWDEEYTKLLAAAGIVGVNVGTDHTDPEMLAAIGKWYTMADIAQTDAFCRDNGVAVMHELLFGFPGDTPEKMFRAIEQLLALDPRVIGVKIGIAITPGTPMADRFDALLASGGDLRGYYFHGEPYLNPVFYLDPSFVVPKIFDDIERFVGSEVRRVMIPKRSVLGPGEDTDYSLVNSPRIKRQLFEERKKGAFWYYYGQ